MDNGKVHVEIGMDGKKTVSALSGSALELSAGTERCCRANPEHILCRVLPAGNRRGIQGNHALLREPGGQPGMEEGVSRVRTNLAERLGYEPPEIPEGESLEERRERIRAIYQWRKAMRRLARLGCIWLSGVGFALCIIAGCAHATEIAAVLGGVSLTTFFTGICL